jgi:hypothetical protein
MTKRSLIFTFCIGLSTSLLGQASLTLRTSTSPTDYSQCDEINSLNQASVAAAASNDGSCAADHHNEYRDYRDGICIANGIPFGSFPSCTRAVSVYCELVNGSEKALSDCRGKVRAVKEALELMTESDKIQRDNDMARTILWKITSGAIKLSDSTLPEPAKRLFKSQLSRAQIIHDNVFASLEVALKTADGYGGGSRDYRQITSLVNEHPLHPLLVIEREIIAKAPQATEISCQYCPQTSPYLSAAIDSLKMSALDGSAIAARTLARAYLRGVGVNQSDEEFGAWSVYAAAYGSELALQDVGFYYDGKHDFTKAKDWYELAAEVGAPYATSRLRSLSESSVNPPVGSNTPRTTNETSARSVGNMSSTTPTAPRAMTEMTTQWP